MIKTSIFEELVLNYHKYVISLSHELGASHDAEFQKELISIGNLALCEVALKYDPNYGDGFSTYAYKSIRGFMLNYMNGLKHGSNYDEQENLLEKEDSQNLYIMQERNTEDWKRVDYLLAHSHLTAQENDIVRRRYGIDCPAQSTQEIATHYHRTVQQINNIKRAACAKMRMAA